MIGYFVRAGDIQVSKAFNPYKLTYSKLLKKRVMNKKYSELLILILIEYFLEGKHLGFPKKPYKVTQYSKKERAITVVVGVPKDFETLPEIEKRLFITTTTMRAIQLVKNKMERLDFLDIDFPGLIEDVEACSREYLELSSITDAI